MIGANNSNRPSHNSSHGNWTTSRDYKLLLEWMKTSMSNLDLISEYANPKECATVYNSLLYDDNFPLGVVFDWSNM